MHRGAPYGGLSSSQTTKNTFGEDEADEDEAEELGLSHVEDTPLTQSSQPPQCTQRRPRDVYTTGTDALSRKGKGKARRQ